MVLHSTKRKKNHSGSFVFFSALAISNRDLRSYCLNVNSEET